MDNFYWMADHNQSVMLAFKRAVRFSWLVLQIQVHSRFHDPQREILGDVSNGGVLKGATVRSVKTSMPKKAFHWLTCFETAVLALLYALHTSTQISGFLFSPVSGAGFKWRDPDPFTFHFNIERGSVCRRLHHSYLLQPHLRTKIVCEWCIFVEFDQALRKKSDYGRTGETWKERKNRTVLKSSSKSATAGLH